VNLVGALVGGQSLKFQVVFKSADKNKKKLRNFSQNRFSTKSILIFGVTLKQMTV